MSMTFYLHEQTTEAAAKEKPQIMGRISNLNDINL